MKWRTKLSEIRELLDLSREDDVVAVVRGLKAQRNLLLRTVKKLEIRVDELKGNDLRHLVDDSTRLFKAGFDVVEHLGAVAKQLQYTTEKYLERTDQHDREARKPDSRDES